MYFFNTQSICYSTQMERYINFLANIVHLIIHMRYVVYLDHKEVSTLMESTYWPWLSDHNCNTNATHQQQHKLTLQATRALTNTHNVYSLSPWTTHLYLPWNSESHLEPSIHCCSTTIEFTRLCLTFIYNGFDLNVSAVLYKQSLRLSNTLKSVCSFTRRSRSCVFCKTRCMFAE